MGLLDKISDDFQHSRGQKDGAHGKLFGTNGDAFTKKYREGFDAGRYDYDKKKYGETLAKVAKAERDFAKRISEGGKKSEKVAREEPSKTEESCNREAEYCPICGEEYDGVYCYNCDDYYDDDEDVNDNTVKTVEYQHENAPGSEIEKLAGSSGLFHVYHYTIPQAIKKALNSGFYSGVTFVPPDYLCTYKCTRCGHEWNSIKNEYSLDKSIKCIMGCSTGDGEPSLSGLYKIIKSLITGKEPFGYGRLIRSKIL